MPIHSPTVSFPVSPYTRSFRCLTPSPRCVGRLGRCDGTKYPFSKDTRKKKAHSPRPQSQLRTPASHRVYCICCCLLHLCLVPIRPQPVLATLVAVIDSGSRATLSRSICSPQRPAAPKRAAFTARSPLSSSTRDPRSQPQRLVLPLASGPAWRSLHLALRHFTRSSPCSTQGTIATASHHTVLGPRGFRSPRQSQ